MTFSDLGLTPETLRAIEDVGYNEPTPIQEQAIPYVLMCRDVLGIAQTGTGKTASFTLPMIDILAQGRAKARMPRSLILAPTRELASQVAENFKLYGKYHKLAMALLIGGESFKEQEAALDKGVDVLIATPGRLMDLFDRGRILLQDVKILVIDEADRMLDMGFIPDVERIVSFLPKIRQTLFFSATMDAQIRKLADAFLMNPKEIRVSPKTSTAATVKQALVIVDQHDKRRALRELLDKEDVRNAFIFCNRKRDVGVLFRSLTKHGYDAVQLHGDMPQNERTVMLDRFKKGDAKLMVCSDVAARGIDISDVSHVFNFDVPSHSEDYVHRIGRTGRAGKEGHAYTLATPEDTKYVEGIEKLIGNSIPRVEVESVETADLDADEGRGRRRGAKRGGRKADRPEKPRRSEDKQPPVAAEEPRKEEETAAPPAPQEKPDREAEVRGGDRRRPERGNGRRNSRRRDDHPAWEVEEIEMPRDAVAFGGHTPAFMLVDPEAEGLRIRAEKDRKEAEAEKRRAAAEARRAEKEAAQAEAEETAAETAEAEAPAGEDAPVVSTDAAEAAAEEPKKRRRTRRPRKSEKPAQPPAAAVDAAVQAVDEVLNGEAEGPKAPETTVEPAGEPVSMEAAPDQGTQAEVASDASGESVAEPAGEPVSTEPPAEEGAEPKGKTRRTRTTKAKATPAKPRRTAAKKDAPAEAETGEAAASADEATDAEAEAPKKKAPARRTAAKKTTTARKSTTTRTRKKAAPAADAGEKPAAPVEGEAATTATPEPAADAEAPAKPKRTRAKASTTAKKTATRKAPAKKATATRSRKKPAADEAPAPEAENAEASSASD
ncbi:ATP-dependent RNA helicase [Caenispirillum salinarum AK4]|uniref:DEAD-box ATP-dependent RNA helicase RhpA n=1 Tax=Caenispirillum salinarum AK4 TaxID=1238182 RepID=K9H749_9PROT|nr:ATP-dependent RNA helicase [Caenispirillum salinarum AK4]